MAVKSIGLHELNSQIKESLLNNFPTYFWIIAEISELKVNFKGHCYLELIEKDDISDTIVAKSRATIWSNVYRLIKSYFETSTKQTFESGIKILIKASVEFHEVFGMSLNIIDIDPSYTIGDLTIKKQQTIRQLEEEGVLEMNRELALPTFIQKIAIISSKQAAGYEDFITHLNQNSANIKIYTKLFPSIMQGNDAENSIIQSLDKINSTDDFFDIVVLIRGGGSQIDLSCFDNYWLAYNIAQFPLPVFTGIGHEKDESIADIVANTRFKTPTAVANYINDHNIQLAEHLQNLQTNISNLTKDFVHDQLLDFKDLIYRIKNINTKLVQPNERYLLQITQKLKSQLQHLRTSKQNKLHEHKIFLSKRLKKQALSKQQELVKHSTDFTHALKHLSLIHI